MVAIENKPVLMSIIYEKKNMDMVNNLEDDDKSEILQKIVLNG